LPKPNGTKEIFDLSGPRDQVCKALSLCGILTTDEHIERALEANEDTPSETSTAELATFRNIVVAVC